MKLIVNTLEKPYMPLHISIFFYSDLNDFSGFFFISIQFWNAIMSDMGVFHCHFVTVNFYFHLNMI